MSAKDAKKKAKLQARIDELEATLRSSLGKKDSKTTEINVGQYTRQIAELKAQLASM